MNPAHAPFDDRPCGTCGHPSWKHGDGLREYGQGCVGRVYDVGADTVDFCNCRVWVWPELPIELDSWPG